MLDLDRKCSETPRNFCPTPHGCSRKLLEVDSLVNRVPKAQCQGRPDQGDKHGPPVMMRLPAGWLPVMVCASEQRGAKVPQKEFEGVHESALIWQVGGHLFCILYGRQSAAAQYRDRLEEVLPQFLPKDRYNFKQVKLECVCASL